MNLKQALRLDRGTRLALVGAGGKTTALFQAARQLAAAQTGLPVLISASTHLGAWQLDQADRHFSIESKAQLLALENQLPPGRLLFTGPRGDDQRMAGLPPDCLDELARMADRQQLPLLVEADGSRQRSLKAPAEHEPAIPGWANLVVVVAGLSALGHALDESRVHRPERFSRLAGLSPGETITAEHLARLLTHSQGGLKNIPPEARRVALLNQADTPEAQAGAQILAQRLRPTFDAVLICSLHARLEADTVLAVHEPVAGIILAAGDASRYGRLKQLLPWQGEPLVRRVARTALQAGLSPVVLVSGAQAAEVEAAVKDLPVQVAQNPDWRAGQSTSVVTGINALPADCGAAIFLLADQPQISSTLIRSLVEERSSTLPVILAPLVNGQRSNPVLFDRQTFPDLLALSGDTGGRALFSRYKVAWLPWHDPGPLLDIDTPQDYQRLLKQQGRQIAAVILAAGLSRRMGRPKMILPWGGHTVIGQVIRSLAEAGLGTIVAVVGGARQQIEAALADLPVQTVFNPRFEQDDMLSSLQTGLSVLAPEIQAALVVLGDQPQIESEIVTAVVDAFQSSGAELVIPSYHRRRGHPWLIARSLWGAIQSTHAPDTMRDFIDRHADRIHYLNVDNPSVLKDLDTPDDYERERPVEG